ncbi:Serine/threonine-protein phosphatase 4 catalytic subunit 1 [Frankliniella fusca]|uniref:Serine/threonine-protein phosphatase 4 catalytic subunit 1 n=1 Tax=Frankliniella fusca TaxID=407009 RepID=A0AAE1LGQ3_9NEOP|nr:Serine/threonine-protein phosphatase 4 catalytic subunit 1 [Frankliniella fusca]
MSSRESDDESCASEIYFSEEDDVYNKHEDPPVYNGAPISVSESMTSILSFVIRHELSGQEIIDLLNLVNLHCKEEDNEMKTSLYFFKKYFSCLDCPVVYHYYCSSCFAKVEKIEVCPNAKLHAGKNDKSIFVELPLVPQLQKLFAQEQFFSNLSYRHTRKKTTPENLEDINDGQLYKELLGFLSESELNFTMMLNTDGVPVFKSSQKSLWPIFLNVMEQPPKYRFKKEFTLIAGLWFGCKPEANMILDPLVKSFNCVRTGFHVRPPGRSNSCISKGIVLAATTDLPAKIMLLGMTSYSGAFGCQICKIKGRSVQITKKQRKKVKKKTDENNEEKLSSVWVYPYSDELDLRSHQETKDLGNKAYQLLMAVGNVKIDNLGVKYPSAITQIMYDVIRGFAVDDLHTLYLGVTKTLTKLLFDSKHSSEPYSLRKYLHLVDERLLKIKLPNVFERCIRKIDGEFSYWKGKECETYIHYLSIAVLDGIMSDKYLEHHIDLVECLHILQSPSISPEKLLACSKKLDNYVKNFEVLYGTRNMSMVIHLLQHLVFVVTNLGPLRYCSCYPYESLNGDILKIIHGTRSRGGTQ